MAEVVLRFLKRTGRFDTMRGAIVEEVQGSGKVRGLRVLLLLLCLLLYLFFSLMIDDLFKLIHLLVY